MSEISWVNGVETDSISVNNRGLAYGDGLFETIAVRAGRPQLLDLHLQRLYLGCHKLAINLDPIKLRTELNAFIERCCVYFSGDAVVKLIICRQSSGRGYASDPSVEASRILTGFSSPSPDFNILQRGVALRFCTTPISINPSLAGMKHLCRLDNVLARGEWVNSGLPNADFFDGLMLDDHQNVIEGTMSNLFLVKNNTLITPSLERCGVAGVMREWVITVLAEKLNLPVTKSVLNKADLWTADELFVCNSLHKLVPVKRLGDHSWTAWPITAMLHQLSEELMLA